MLLWCSRTCVVLRRRCRNVGRQVSFTFVFVFSLPCFVFPLRCFPLYHANVNAYQMFEDVPNNQVAMTVYAMPPKVRAKQQCAQETVLCFPSISCSPFLPTLLLLALPFASSIRVDHTLLPI